MGRYRKTKKIGDWDEDCIGDLAGKVMIVTGGTSGLGLATATTLARYGATVIIASRDPAKGERARDHIDKACDTNSMPPIVDIMMLDLMSLESVQAFASQFKERYEKLDVLVNNAGTLGLPERTLTPEGFEATFATNHLGHFALTCLLLPVLRKSSAPRVVVVSSLAAREAKIDFENLNSEKKYDPWKAYKVSKLANALFAVELQKKSDANRWNLFVTTVHPGFVLTDLFRYGGTSCIGKLSTCCCGAIMAQKVQMGARPSLYGALAGDKPGCYYGPNGCGELRGGVGVAKWPSDVKKHPEVASKLWDVSCEMTNSTW